MSKFIVFAIIGLLLLSIIFGVYFFLAKLTIWVIGGLFNVDLTDKFWYIFGGLWLISTIFGGTIRIKS